MNFIEKMNFVDDIANDISTKIGMLTQQGVFTFDEGVKIIETVIDAQMKWMKTSFTDDEYHEYMMRNKG